MGVIRDDHPFMGEGRKALRLRALATLAENSEGTKVILKETASDCIVEMPSLDRRIEAVIAPSVRVRNGDLGYLVFQHEKLYFYPAR